MSILTSLIAATNYRSAFLRGVVPAVGLAFGIQAAFAVPSILVQSERFYDVSGSLTYLSCTALSLYLPAIRARSASRLAGAPLPAWPSLLDAFRGQGGPLAFNWRQVALSAAVCIWAARLGTFLYERITKDQGQDPRFKEIRVNPTRFFSAFMIQAVWVSLCLMPTLAVNALPASTFAALGTARTFTDVTGILLYVGGLGFETIADRQKTVWLQEKKDKKHSDEFLARGLWSKSRHPNYFGESTLWTGIATVAAGVLASNAGLVGLGFSTGLGGTLGALMTAGISPMFVTFLLLKVSGIPLTEKSHDKKFGKLPEYQRWKKETPRFIPKF